jgi:hypothetical protein
VRKTIAVDWDGVMVEYHGYEGPAKFGPSIQSMVDRVKNWLVEGHEVIIHTSRVSIEHTNVDRTYTRQAIRLRLKSMGLPEDLLVTANKFTRISEFWDDRAVRVERNTGETYMLLPKAEE